MGKKKPKGKSTMTWYTYKEVAETLKVSVQSVRHWVRTGQLPVSRISHRTVRINKQDLDAFIATKQGPACVKQ
jgi:excisionase family DNA binding protein